MRRKSRVIAVVLVTLLAVVGIGLFGAYQASQHVPEFYTKALTQETVEQEQASHELGARVTTLYNDARRTGSWQAMFSAEQINAWLSIDLVEKHGDLLPENLSDPRVQIAPELLTLAMRVEDATITTVFSLGVEVYIDKPNQVAFRVRKARAGALPLPLGDILEQVSAAAQQAEVPLRWTEVDGDPVALLTISPADKETDALLVLEKLELREGAIYLSGHTVSDKGSSNSSGMAKVKRLRVATIRDVATQEGNTEPKTTRQR